MASGGTGEKPAFDILVLRGGIYWQSPRLTRGKCGADLRCLCLDVWLASAPVSTAPLSSAPELVRQRGSPPEREKVHGKRDCDVDQEASVDAARPHRERAEHDPGDDR